MKRLHLIFGIFLVILSFTEFHHGLLDYLFGNSVFTDVGAFKYNCLVVLLGSWNMENKEPKNWEHGI